MANNKRQQDKPEVGLFFCEECERYFDTEEEYREHNRIRHQEEKEEVGRPTRR